MADRTVRAIWDDDSLWYVYGTASINFNWSTFIAPEAYYTKQWLTIEHKSLPDPETTASVHLSGDPEGTTDPRQDDRVTIDLEGAHDVGPDDITYLILDNVEYVDSTITTTTHLWLKSHFGFTTDGSLDSITANIGNHEMIFTTAIKNSTLDLGDGWDTVTLSDQLDIPGTQYWTLIRNADNSLMAYSLLTGNYVHMVDGENSRNGETAYHNFGEVEQLYYLNSRTGGTVTVIPGRPGDGYLPQDGDLGLSSNIDLRSDGSTFTDSFNLAYFNFIRYTSDNVWAGQSTVYDDQGTPAVNDDLYSSPTSHTISNAPILSGELSVIGQSRNGTHDLIIAEQTTALDGHLRVYSQAVNTRVYNEFNVVYLGTSSAEFVNKSGDLNDGVAGTVWADRVALYGFGGNDVLIGGTGNDYIFGGQSTFNQVSGDTGNQVTGGAGADYFGVGNTNSSGTVTGSNSTISSGSGYFLEGYATDVIMDWHASVDTLFVLTNGVAVIGGLYGTTLTNANTIDLASHTAVAKSDQDGDGARGGDNWDATQSLQYIYDHQSTRDANSIANESDVSVVNNGLIVARGLDGSDTLIGSSGNDYLYGNLGTNIIDLSKGGSDRVYVDALNLGGGQYVLGFDGSNDKIYLNEDVVNAFKSGLSLTSGAQSVTASYTGVVNYNPSINYLHDVFYSPSILDTNANHNTQDGQAPSALSGSDGTTFGIGVGMVAGGFALLFVPFMSGVGYALIASGTALGGGSAFINTQEHQNATISGNYNHYINILNNTYKPVTSYSTESNGTYTTNSNNLKFLDFFANTTPSDGFVKALEFTGMSQVYGYFAVESTTETFIYLVASRDKLVEDSEAIKVAEINGTGLTVANFESYIGTGDIYNYGTIAAITLVSPEITSVRDSGGTADEGMVDKLIDGVINPVLSSIVLDGAKGSGSLKVYDGTTLIYDESAGSLVNANVSATYNSGNLTYTLTDSRALGTYAMQTDTNAITGDNSFTLTDKIVNYSIEFSDGATGISTRDGSGGITITGGNSTINGDSGADTLNISGTSSLINNASDGQIIGIESIMLSGKDTNGNGSIGSEDDTVVLSLANQTEAFSIYGSSIQDSITAGSGNDKIYAMVGNDTINAGNGDDSIYGFIGSDYVNGGGGTDRIMLSGTSTDFNNAVDAQLSLVEIVELDVTASNPVLSITLSGSVVSAVSIMNAGSGLTDGTYTNISLGGNNTYTSAALATVTVSGGIATGVTLTSAGSGYTSSDPISVQSISTDMSLTQTISIASQTEGFIVYGDSTPDSIIGGSGNDTIYGYAGNDTLSGGSGNDIFIINSASHATNDVIQGGAGTDYIYFISTSSGDNLILSANVSDTDNSIIVKISDSNGSTTGTTSLNVNADLLNTDMSVIIYGNDGSNVIYGNGDQYNTIYGNGGNDAIYGGSDSDVIYGGSGNDTMTGYSGIDTFYVDSGADNISDISYGNNSDIVVISSGASLNGTVGGTNWTATSSTSNNGSATITTSSSSTKVDLGLVSGTSGWSIYGNNGNDSIYGSNNADYIDAGSGANIIGGNDGDDTIISGSYADINLGGGVDRLILNSLSHTNMSIGDFSTSDFFVVSNIKSSLSNSSRADLTLADSATTLYGLIALDGMSTTGIGSGTGITSGNDATNSGNVAGWIDYATDNYSYENAKVLVFADGTAGDDTTVWFWQDGGSGDCDVAELTYIGIFHSVEEAEYMLANNVIA